MYCFKKTDVVPDIVTMAKPIANGLPMGAVVVSDNIAKIMKPGDHGTTFGGSPLTTAVANYVWSVISEPKFLKHVKDMGTYSKEKADAIIKKSPLVKQFRGQGLLMGLEFRENVPNNVFVDHCRDHGLLVVGAGSNTVRLLPPLIVQKEEIEEAFEIIATVLQTM